MVVVVVVVVVDVDVDVRPRISDISIAWAPCCSRSFSMENGVVETVGQPVNSVVALNSMSEKYFNTESGLACQHYTNLIGNPLRIVMPGRGGPSTCNGLGVVARPLPGRLPIPLGKTILKLGDALLDGASDVAADLFKLNPGGKKLEISAVFSLILVSTLGAPLLSVPFNLKPGGKNLEMSSLNKILGDSAFESDDDGADALKPGGKSLLSSEIFGAAVVDLVVLGNLKPGGKNLLMSSTIVISDSGRLLVLSLDLKPGGKNLLTSSVTVLNRNGALVVACNIFL